MKIHTGDKSFHCHQCDKSFYNISILRVHQKTHAGARDHVCEYCNKAYYSRYSLRMHMKIHAEDKPYPCDKCSKSFLTSAKLRSHQNGVHSESKPYKCVVFMKTEEDYDLYPTDPLAFCTPNQIEGSIIKPQTEGLSAQISPKQEAVGASIKLEKIKENYTVRGLVK